MSTYTAVYRCFDADGRLLYIGQATDPHDRLKKHRSRGSVWVDDVARTESVYYADRIDALKVERHATHAESPLYPSVVDGSSAIASAVACIFYDLIRQGHPPTHARALARQIVQDSGYADGDDHTDALGITEEELDAIHLEQMREGLQRLCDALGLPTAS